MIRGTGAYICGQCIGAALDTLVADNAIEHRRAANADVWRYALDCRGVVISYSARLGRGSIRTARNLPSCGNARVILHGTCLRASGFSNLVPRKGADIHFLMALI